MLKHKSIFTIFMLLTALLLGSATNTYASVPTGYFDQMEGNTIVGWGWDSATPNTAIPIRVTVTNQETAEVMGEFRQTAAIRRNDLIANNIGNGNHGFRITVKWDTFPDGIYLIEGWADDKKFANTQTYSKGIQAAAEPVAEVADTPNSNMRSLGTFRTTAYCPCYSCSEGWGRRTSTGAIAKANHTIAVDPRVIPYGSKVMINGVIYTAEDRGGGVKGNHIDIFFDTHSQTRQHGSQRTEVFLLP